MTQPEYVPLNAADRVRPVERLPPSRPWRADRPADLVAPGLPTGPRLGSPGPDLGYGMKLARTFAERLVLGEGEAADDALAGCFAVGTKRSTGRQFTNSMGPPSMSFDATLSSRIEQRPPLSFENSAKVVSELSSILRP